MMRRVVAVWLALGLLGGTVGCASAPLAPPPESGAVPVEPSPPVTSDSARLKDSLTGREMSPAEVADLSDRLLAAGSKAFNDQQTMARLELVILKTLKDPDKSYRPVLWRNLGIIHYHQKKYKQAEHNLQSANELNPKNARTHFYLACLFAHKGRIYQKSGKTRASQQQYKRAAIEIGLARKLEPSNALYKQDPKQIIQQENGK
ncbi:MAG: tetratricopeptide repeat protein [Deltaproteobacteria bacterium]|nr:tetratricopeptide repeat protein [Deltaproteobacteria bacterium]